MILDNNPDFCQAACIIEQGAKEKPGDLVEVGESVTARIEQTEILVSEGVYLAREGLKGTEAGLAFVESGASEAGDVGNVAPILKRNHDDTSTVKFYGEPFRP